MKMSELLRKRVVRVAILLIALVGYGSMVGCEYKTVDRGGGHPDWHDDRH